MLFRAVLLIALAAPLAAQDFSAAAARRLSSPARVRLNNLPVLLQSAQVWNDGETTTWSGLVDTPLPGSFTLAITGSLVSGALTTGTGQAFEISGTPSNLIYTPVEPNGPFLCPVLAEPPPPAAEAVGPVRELGPASEMDILVVYSAAAKTTAGGPDAILNQIRQSIAYSNQAFVNSGLSISLNLVGVQEVDLPESGSCSTDLNRITTLNDGIADNVGALRNQLGADLVSLWVSVGNCGGIAWLLNSPAGLPDRAFSLTVNGSPSAYRNEAFAHEIGHNLGSAHDRANAASTGLFPYSYGYQNTDAQPFFRDIMAYECAGAPCPRQPYFSNVLTAVNNRAIGIAAPAAKSADAAATFILSAPVIESYRPRGTVPSGSLTLSPSSVLTAPLTGGTLSINVVSNTTSQASTTTPWISAITPASGSGNRTVTFQVAANPNLSARIGSITFQTATTTQTLIINQLSVTGTISPSSASTGSAAGSGSFQLTLSAPSFPWSATVNAPGNWLTLTPASGTGSRFITYNFTANGFGSTRTGTISIGDQIFTLTQSSGTFTVTSPIITLPAVGGSSTFNIVTTPPGSPWSVTAFGFNGWLSVSPESGVGSQTVTYTATSNSFAYERSGTFYIGSQQIPVRQLGKNNCTVTTPIAVGNVINASLTNSPICGSAYRSNLIFPVPAARYSFAGTAGQSIRITMDSSSLDSYLFLTGPNGERIGQNDNGGGGLNAALPTATGFLVIPATGTYIIEATTGDSSPSGSGVGYTLRVLGSTAASSTLIPASATVPAAAGSGTLNLTVSPSALYRTANAFSDGNWLTVTPATGSGNGALPYTYFANPSTTPRTATIQAAGQVFTITQSAAPASVGDGPSPRPSGPIFLATSSSDKFTFNFSHPGGYQQLGVVNGLINSALDGGRACYFAYSQPAGLLFLVNDNGPESGLSAPLSLTGGSNPSYIANSQCAIFSLEASAIGNGNVLTLTLRIFFEPTFAGNRVLYLAARGGDNSSSGWKTQGAIAIPPAATTYPRSGPASPAAGTAATSVLRFVYQHDTLVNNLQTVWALMGTAVDARNACYVAYYVPGNLLLLIPDSGDGNQATAMALSGSGTLENSQCRISAAGSSAVFSDGQLTLNLNTTFKAPFSSNPFGMWTAAQNQAVQTSPWKIVGAWQVNQ